MNIPSKALQTLSVLAIAYVLFSPHAIRAKILIIEHQDHDYESFHGEKVSSIACKYNNENCILVYNESLIYLPEYFHHDEQHPSPYDSNSFFNAINDGLKQASVVNISLFLQQTSFSNRQTERYELGLELLNRDIANATGVEKTKLLQIKKKLTTQHQLKRDEVNAFEPRVEGFRRLISNHQDHLFVIAMGNASLISPSSSPLKTKKGVGLSLDLGKYKGFPAMFNRANTLKVAAVDSSGQLADYSNYSLEVADVAAPIETSSLSKEALKGTSFATPKVSRLADKIKQLHPSLNPRQIKAIIIKTCDVNHIDKAIAASVDLNTNGKKSKTYQAMFNRKLSVRDQLKKELGPILFVKCGGVINEKRALSCSKNFVSSGQSIMAACLKAHAEEQSQKSLEELTLLWKVRKI